MNHEWLSASRVKPQPEQRVVVRAKDAAGQYELPFPVRYRGGSWYNARTGTRVDAYVVGWRMPPKDMFKRNADGPRDAASDRPTKTHQPPKAHRLKSVFGSPEDKALFEKAIH